MYTVNDLQIFIATHNRADFLKESIYSLLNQTAGIKEITVLDNESTDNTEEVVGSFESQGVKYIKTQGFLGNFNKAREIVNKPYCMLFHDDDLIHPKYLEFVLKELNETGNISMLTTRYTEFKNNEIPSFDDVSSAAYLFKTQKEFAEFLYFKECVAYAPVIYRTKDFLSLDLEYDKFSKFNDWPFLLKMAGCGNVVLFKDKKMFYVRRHDGQDTNTFTNSVNINQIANWDKAFFDAVCPEKSNIILYKRLLLNTLYFSFSKYKFFLTEDFKQEHSFNEILEEIVKVNPEIEKDYLMELYNNNKEKVELFVKPRSFLQQIFSMKNVGKYKVVCILGLCFKLERSKR